MVDIKFYSENPHDPFHSHIEDLSDKNEIVNIAVGFISKSGMELINGYLKKNLKLRINLVVGAITGNSVAVIGMLDSTVKKRIDCRINLGSKTGAGSAHFAPMMHTKMFIGIKNNKRTAIIGSSNLSYFAMYGKNAEANVIMNGVETDKIFIEMQRHFDSVWKTSKTINPKLAIYYHALSKFRHQNQWGYPELRNDPVFWPDKITVNGIWYVNTKLPNSLALGNTVTVGVLKSKSPSPLQPNQLGNKVLIILYDSSKSKKSTTAYFCEVSMASAQPGVKVTTSSPDAQIVYDPSTTYFQLIKPARPGIGSTTIINSLEVKTAIPLGSLSIDTDIGGESHKVFWKKKLETEKSKTVGSLHEEKFYERDRTSAKEQELRRITGFTLGHNEKSIVQSLSTTHLRLKRTSNQDELVSSIPWLEPNFTLLSCGSLITLDSNQLEDFDCRDEIPLIENVSNQID